MATVRIPPTLRTATGGAREVEGGHFRDTAQTPFGEQQAQRAAPEREQDTLGKHLSDEAASPGPQSGAYREFP